MKSSITVTGVVREFEVDMKDFSRYVETQMGFTGLERLVGSRVRIKPEVHSLMMDSYAEPGRNRAQNVHAEKRALPVGLLTKNNPALEQEFIVTSVNWTEFETIYLNCRNVPEIKRKEPCLLINFSRVIPEGPFTLPLDYCLSAPVDHLDFLELSKETEQLPAPGTDYMDNEMAVKAYQFHQLDLRVDGYSNLPTALVGRFLDNWEHFEVVKKSALAEFGYINSEVLKRLTRRFNWEDCVSKKDREVTGYPSKFLNVDYEELAKKFA